jgi:acetyl-CoA carboxylase carboxyl transferase subunit beta
VSGARDTQLSSARERAALVVDPGSIEPWDTEVVSNDPLGFTDVRPYRERLAEAERRTGLREAVLTGRATVAGRPVALVAAEFGFLGGSIGVATGERIARAFERAIEQRLALVALPATGGSRMQEGTLALVQMAKLAVAARTLRDAGLPYIVCLTHPTTGGVLASWGSLGTVTFALRDALIGFAGPRVVELLTGAPLAADVQRAETLLARGLIDAVLDPSEARAAVGRALDATAPAPRRDGRTAPATFEPPTSGRAPSVPGRTARCDAWTSLAHARNPARPGADAVLDTLASDRTELRGDRTGRPDDRGCYVALARIEGWRAVVIAQRRDGHGRPPALKPEGYGKARRAIALAAELRLPLLTIVDTPGAELSAEAERGGLAAEIAGCLADLGSVEVPTLALLLGEGGSGGALAFLLADRVICAEHASLGVIAPEGASAILHRDLDHAPELAATQGGASWQLLDAGIVETIVAEPAPAHVDPTGFIDRVAAALAAELSALLARDRAERLAARRARWRMLGTPPSAA